MDLLDLKIFRDIAHEKSFVKTAKLNSLTQPAISSHVKHMEEDLGVRLFERVPRKVELTKSGELLLPYVEDLLLKVDDLKSLVDHAKRTPQGDIRIATVYSVGIYELAPLLKKFIRAYPKIHIHLQYRRSDIIYDLLLKNKIDVGVVAYPESRARIKVTPFGSDQLVLIVPSHHPLAKKRSTPLNKIRGEKFIAFDTGIPTREAIDDVLKQKGIEVLVAMSNDNIDTLKKAVEVGLGISIVPRKTVEEEVRKGKLKSIQISDVKLGRPLGIITLKDRVLGYAVQVFIDTLTKKMLRPASQ